MIEARNVLYEYEYGRAANTVVGLLRKGCDRITVTRENVSGKELCRIEYKREEGEKHDGKDG